MGIDAEVLLRVKGTPPTDDQLIDWSYNLAVSVGAKKFFIDPEKGYRAIHRTNERYRDDSDDVGEIGRVYHQDGPSIVAAPDETFLQVFLWTRYYGPGYERGDILSIIAVAEWCERNIPDCAVWYGGDSSGVLAKPFDKPAREEMLAHLMSMQGREYYSRGTLGLGGDEFGLPPQHIDCSSCPAWARPTRCGWGNSFALYDCAGCGRRWETRDAGKTWAQPKESP